LSPSGTTLGRSAFLRLALTLAIAAVIAWGYAVFTIIRTGGEEKVLGWAAAYSEAGWHVVAVDPAGPAFPALEVGDRLVAVDGHQAVQLTGPRWVLRDAPERTRYDLTVVREGRTVELTLDWPTRRVPGLRGWLWTHLLTGIVYVVVGLLIAFARPESMVARRAVLSAALSGAFFMGAALNVNGGMLAGGALALAMISYAVRPFHLVAGYRFNAAFPLGEPSRGKWRAFETFLYLVAAAIWLPSVTGAVLRALGPVEGAALAASLHPFPLVHDRVVDSLGILFAAVISVANPLVMLRNYRAVTDGDLKRRIRWVSIAVGVGMVPILVVAPLLIFGYAAGNREQFTTIVRIVNTLTVIIPLCIGYAVIKHRVLGIRVVIRAGLQYLFARNVLRFALALPLIVIGWTIVSNPNATLAELATGPGGGFNLALLAVAGIGLRYRTSLLRQIDRRFFREAYDRDRIFLTLSDAVARAADTTEISRLLSSQIQAALHPSAIFAVARDEGNELSVLYSSSGRGAPRSFGHFNLGPSAFRDLESATDVDRIERLNAEEKGALAAVGVALVVPIRGPNEGLLGLLLLGEKLSEEPYTRHDREMLGTVASQTGTVWENLRLRERLVRERDVRRGVVARLDGVSEDILMECSECGRCYGGTTERCEDDGTALSPSMGVPRTLDGKYRLERLLGRGGMGAVYAATDIGLGRTVAVKIAAGTIFDDSIAMQRFSREARASAKLDHPNVVRAFDFGEVPHGAYLVLEHLHGTTLRQELRRRGCLAPAETAAILADVFRGIEAAHSRGIVHRDLKPENIFLARDGDGATVTTKILDFGLAVVRDISFADREKLTQTGTAVGTLAYMSAEQFLGETVDERADVFALGMVALEMLTGELSSRGPTFGRISAILEERIVVPGAPPAQLEIARVLGRALIEDRALRYQSVAEFSSDLLPLLSSIDALVPGSGGLPSSPPREGVALPLPSSAPTKPL
jgi:eukaryotic-like serine/threonine-protein kinase